MPPLFLIPLLSFITVFMTFRINELHLVFDKNHGPLYFLLISLPLLQFKWVSFAIVFILLTTQIFFFNFVVNRYEVLYKKSNIPAIVYLLLYACIPEFLMLSPFLILNSLLPALFYSLFGIYKSERPMAFAFDAGFVLALMILFYIPSVILVPFLFTGIAILRPFSTREWITAFLGMIVPFILMLTVLILLEKLPFFYEGYHNDDWMPVFNPHSIEKKYWIAGSAIAMMFILSIVKISKNYYKNIIRTRKYQLCFMLLFLFVVIIVILPIQNTPARFNLLISPVALFLSYYFLTIKKNWWFEVLTLILLSLILLNYLNFS